ncbi:MAG: D-glycerate dehydrogenase [bacterium (Candidatus Stahlbacteria) CG23_combo_of_CG06-09_8_20_14_all_34_7]|nr:MAG: D-glycerate dehydrogenase [bacterium (Candidatus Stahlbacteria) CG23_combo_of_CG06-09_8_20_14_all_34_7]
MKVLITSPLPLDLKYLLNPFGIEVTIGSGRMTEEEIIESVKDKDGIITLLRDKIDKNVIDSAKNLKIIANYAVGYDNIDIKFAKDKNIYVTNTPSVLTDATADLTFSLLLSCARRISEADRYVREGNFHGWRPDEMLGMDIKGKTLGIFGFGRIGQEVMKRSLGFGMNIIYTSNFDKKVKGAKKVDFETLLRESDFISLNASLNDSNKHSFTINEFKKMKRNAIIVNTARGQLIKEDDLVYALEQKIINYAGLDVYEFEPKITEKLKKLDNVILAPHMGSATVDTRMKMAKICYDSIKDVLIDKRRPSSCVNC